MKGVRKVVLLEKVTLRPLSPVREESIITPPAALEPYSAAADGPTRADMSAISSALKLEMPSPVMALPL